MVRRNGYVVRLRHDFRAPIEQVFRAWTDLDMLATWSALEGWEVRETFYFPRPGGDAILSFWSNDGRRNLEVVGQFESFEHPNGFRLQIKVTPSAGRPFAYFGHRLARELTLSLDVRLEAVSPAETALDFLAVSPDARVDDVRASVAWEQRIERLAALIQGAGLSGR
jgi:uncharacterized protein YndB with AHSA1/START domain